jgi:hypothetical protein
MGDTGAAPGLDAAPQGSSAAASPAQPPAQPLRVPHEGLSLAALRAFADAHAGGEYTLRTEGGAVTLSFREARHVMNAQALRSHVRPVRIQTPTAPASS